MPPRHGGHGVGPPPPQQQHQHYPASARSDSPHHSVQQQQQQHVALRAPQALNGSNSVNGVHHLVSPGPAHAHAHHHHPQQQQQQMPLGPAPPSMSSNGFVPGSSVALAASSSTPVVEGRRGLPMPESLVRLAKANEDTWMAIGALEKWVTLQLV